MKVKILDISIKLIPKVLKKRIITEYLYDVFFIQSVEFNTVRIVEKTSRKTSKSLNNLNNSLMCFKDSLEGLKKISDEYQRGDL